MLHLYDLFLGTSKVLLLTPLMVTFSSSHVSSEATKQQTATIPVITFTSLKLGTSCQ